MRSKLDLACAEKRRWASVLRGDHTLRVNLGGIEGGELGCLGTGGVNRSLRLNGLMVLETVGGGMIAAS
jgi:hypothetical protein